MTTKKRSTRIIKKYANRRMYDTETSTYVSNADIKQLILEGKSVKVINGKNNEDITRNILLQIIIDEENTNKPILSIDFLSQIIRFYGKPFQMTISPFLEQGIDVFKEMQRNFYNQIKKPHNSNPIELSANVWQEFIQAQQDHIQDNIKRYIQNNAQNIINMQEQVKKQTEQLFSYMRFPFSNEGKD